MAFHQLRPPRVCNYNLLINLASLRQQTAGSQRNWTPKGSVGSFRRCTMFKNISQRILADVRTEQTLKVLSVPKKPRKEIFKLWLKDKVNNFCNVTSLHGYIHTVNKEYHAFERWLWIILSFFALIAAIVLLWISWNWTAETPTTTVIESTNNPTYNLPFPSVTICNMNKISKSLALEVAKEMWVKRLMTNLF